MLDKGQIKDWDGTPEATGASPTSASAPHPIFDAREGVPTGEYVKMTPEQTQARKRRGQWIALALFAFVILVFALTMAKVGGGVGVPQVYHNDGSQ